MRIRDSLSVKNSSTIAETRFRRPVFLCLTNHEHHNQGGPLAVIKLPAAVCPFEQIKHTWNIFLSRESMKLWVFMAIPIWRQISETATWTLFRGSTGRDFHARDIRSCPRAASDGTHYWKCYRSQRRWSSGRTSRRNKRGHAGFSGNKNGPGRILRNTFIADWHLRRESRGHRLSRASIRASGFANRSVATRRCQAGDRGTIRSPGSDDADRKY